MSNTRKDVKHVWKLLQYMTNMICPECHGEFQDTAKWASCSSCRTTKQLYRNAFSEVWAAIHPGQKVKS